MTSRPLPGERGCKFTVLREKLTDDTHILNVQKVYLLVINLIFKQLLSIKYQTNTTQKKRHLR